VREAFLCVLKGKNLLFKQAQHLPKVSKIRKIGPPFG